MPASTFLVDALLFDMDGTLVDSTPGVVGAWELFKKTYPWINLNDILATSQGVRTVDNLKKYCELSDPKELEREAKRYESAILSTSKDGGRQGIISLPGVVDVLTVIAPAKHYPNPSWAICTSATRAYASSALQIAGVAIPDVFVTADDVIRGKPFPDPYLLGAKQCGVEARKCVVFEDAPSGIRAGNSAGCTTVGLLTTHSREQLEEAKADYIIKDLTRVTFKLLEKGVEVTVYED